VITFQSMNSALERKFGLASTVQEVQAVQPPSYYKGDRGSLTILSTSLFLILVLTSFVIMNASSAFLAKRELVQIGEAVATRAAQHLDQGAYYSNNPTYFVNSTAALPIDCSAAYQSFSNEIAQSNLRDNQIHFSGWSCDGYSIHASISTQTKHLFALPIIGSDNPFTITAEISVLNRLQAAQ